MATSEIASAVLRDGVALFLVRLALAIVAVIVGRWLAHRLQRTTLLALAHVGLAPTVESLLSRGVYVLVAGGALVLALGIVGFPLAGLAAFLGVTGVFFGLALKETIGNLAATILIAVFQPYRVGDTIEIAGTVGTVLEIQPFSTVLVTPQNSLVSVPNGQTQLRNVTNFSARPVRRLEIGLTLAPGTDPAAARAALLPMLSARDDVRPELEAQVAVTDVVPDGVVVSVRPWVSAERAARLEFELREEALACLEHAGVRLAATQEGAPRHPTG